MWWTSKIVLYGYRYRYGFIVYIKTDDIYKDIAEDLQTRFDTSNYELKRPLPKGKKLKNNWINEIWIRWKHFFGLRAKNYGYLWQQWR